MSKDVAGMAAVGRQLQVCGWAGSVQPADFQAATWQEMWQLAGSSGWAPAGKQPFPDEQAVVSSPASLSRRQHGRHKHGR